MKAVNYKRAGGDSVHDDMREHLEEHLRRGPRFLLIASVDAAGKGAASELVRGSPRALARNRGALADRYRARAIGFVHGCSDLAAAELGGTRAPAWLAPPLPLRRLRWFDWLMLGVSLGVLFAAALRRFAGWL